MQREERGRRPIKVLASLDAGAHDDDDGDDDDDEDDDGDDDDDDTLLCVQERLYSEENLHSKSGLQK